MVKLTSALIFLTCFSSGKLQIFQQPANVPGGQNNQLLNRQAGAGGISFIVPGLNLLAGNNANLGGGNGLFGTVTTTRTVVSTVSTVTTASFRTCLAATANLMPCAAGRRRREVENSSNINEVGIQPTPTVQLIIGATTISDPAAVTEYLEAHKPSSQSVIYPKDYVETPAKINPRHGSAVIGEGTILYPSQDTPYDATTESDVSFLGDDDLVGGTTGTPYFQDKETTNDDSEPNQTASSMDTELEFGELGMGDKARRGFAKTTTVTTVIRVTSVATSLATGGATATLTVSYAGCLPASLPFTGMPCV